MTWIFMILVAGLAECFTFQSMYIPLGLIKISGALKLQKEQETSKEGRKVKRRDKKEKRERSKGKKENSKDSERAHKKLKHSEGNELHVKDAYYQIAAAKKIELHMKDGVTEQLERSGLTEEHGPPCHTPEPCESSESTQTSSKGRKLETVGQQGTTIIRFKLPLQKHRDSKPTAIVSEEPCFSGRATSKYPEPVPAKVDEPCFSGRVAVTPIETQGCVTEMPIEMQLGESSKSHKKRRDKERKFRDLVINWRPVPLLVGDDSEEDLGWLLDESRRNRASSDAKSCHGSEDLSDGGAAASSFQPRACYVPELEMYQLPYVIPF